MDDLSGPDELDRLLSAFFDSDEGLAEEARAELNRMLRSAPSIRRRYLLYMGIHEELARLLGGDCPEASGLPGPCFLPPREVGARPSVAVAPVGRRRGGAAVVAAAALAAIVGPAAWWWARSPSGPRPVVPTAGAAPVPAPAPLVARVSASAGARFEGPGAPVEAGRLRTGPYRLAEGIVRLEFAHEAEVLVAAPAEFVIQSEMRLFLARGRLSARVPAPAKGFTVETPSATLVDLGTEFAADVDGEGNGEVHVFRGEVIVQPRSRSDSRPLRLAESQATRVDATTATPSGIDADPGRFLRDLAEPRSDYSRAIRRLAPSVYLPMEPSADGTTLVDAASGPDGRVVPGAPAGTPWAPGRIGASLRLRGPGSGDHAWIPYVQRPGVEELSVVAWVLAESRPRWASILKRWGEPGDRCFHFGLFGDDGDLEVHVSLPDGGEALAREGKPLPTGGWHHVAFVADGRHLRLYRDGEEVASAPYRGLPRSGVDVAGIGVKLDRAGHRPDVGEPGYWHGRLDEIAIFPGALGADRIRSLYRSALGPGPTAADPPREPGPSPKGDAP